MSDPWATDGDVAQVRAARPLRRAPTGSSRRGTSPATTRARDTTCSPSPTTGASRATTPSTGLTVLPSVELNCILPGARDGHVLGYGVARDRGRAARAREASTPTSRRPRTGSAAHGGVSYLAHPYWTGVTPGRSSSPDDVAGIEVFNAGCELEIGRGLSAVHWDELLEDGPALSRRSPPTTRTTRATTPISPGRG